MKLEFSRHIFAKYSNIKFHENPSSDSRVVPCGLSDWERDMTKLTVTFHNFVNKPKNLPSLVIGKNIATGFSDYLTLFMKQRQSSLHKAVLLIVQPLNGSTNKYLFKSHIKITACRSNFLGLWHRKASRQPPEIPQLHHSLQEYLMKAAVCGNTLSTW